MALAYSDRALTKKGELEIPDWSIWFRDFLMNSRRPFECKGEKVVARDEKNPLNNFDLAHLADFWFVESYLKRFFPKRKPVIRQSEIDVVASKLLHNFSAKADDPPDGGVGHPLLKDGQIAFEETEGDWVGHHFFVTLHSLRALSIFDCEIELKEVVEDRLQFVRQFCIQQCFYVQKNIRHLHDTVGLAFAGTIYCLYSQQVSADLCQAIVDSLAAAQQENGSWPTAHPIFRGANRPWHITSHEVALCLTWLYFEPRVPDTARPTLVAMMEQYFRKWVVPTYFEIPKAPRAKDPFCGWLDDHTMSDERLVGWATAIVCHFLANYRYVLDNHLNRRVVESLGLQSNATAYLIDIHAFAKSGRWTRFEERDLRPIVLELLREPSPDDAANSNSDESTSALSRRISKAAWFDLPPFAWQEKPTASDIASQIRWNWTDPSDGPRHHSEKLADHVVLPIYESPGERPWKDLCAGMLPGDPGTRKTSLVQTLGSIVQWPVVTVPASVIFEHGFDSMEARANEVFRRLAYLSGCIIFFDEFEEFFRDRGERVIDEQVNKEQVRSNDTVAAPGTCNYPQRIAPSVHDRTIAAFTTPAMLPRLQELHDEDRCLIFFATNNSDKVDPAIKRPGRFDFRVLVNHPTRERVLEYLESPSKRAYTDIGIKVDEATRLPKDNGKELFREIAGPVKDAVTEVFTVEGAKVKFKFVEDALRKVAAVIADGLEGEKLLKKRTEAAVKSLQDSAKREEASQREPPDLQ
jgi:hypothetical protein